MMKEDENRQGRITIFPLLTVAIVALIVERIGRCVFARQMYEWENQAVAALGINVEAYRIACGILIFAILLAAYLRLRRGRNRAKAGQFVLPGEKS